MKRSSRKSWSYLLLQTGYILRILSQPFIIISMAMTQEPIEWSYPPHIRPIFQGCVREYLHKIWLENARNMVLTYLHLLDPEDLPLNKCRSSISSMISHDFFEWCIDYVLSKEISSLPWLPTPESGYITAQIVSFSAMLQGMTLGAQGWGDPLNDPLTIKSSWRWMVNGWLKCLGLIEGNLEAKLPTI